MIILCLAFAGIELSSCSDSISEDIGSKIYDGLFTSLKNNYSGNLILSDNTATKLKFSIRDEVENGNTSTNVRVTEFPIDNILMKLYPGEYQKVAVTSVDTYVAPVDSVGFPSVDNIVFKTNDDKTANLNFSFKKDGETHNGWAKVSTSGIYNSKSRILDINFQVIDLVVDNSDRSSLTPITYFLECSPQ